MQRGRNTQVTLVSYSDEKRAYKMAERAAIYAVQARQASIWRTIPDVRPGEIRIPLQTISLPASLNEQLRCMAVPRI